MVHGQRNSSDGGCGKWTRRTSRTASRARKGEKVGGWAAPVFAALCNRSNDPLVDYIGHVELLMEYESSISGWTELMYAAARGHEGIVELLKQETGIRNNEHQTALMWAARNDHPECVRLLLKDEGGMQTTKGWTALINAAYSNAVECARLLKENEKELKTISSCHDHSPGTTVLSIAKKKDRKEIVGILPNEICSSLSRSACQLLSE
eukprot:XP_001708662.1 Hypothetical protein GL50803_114590 [Giardia lamblia ATCC 50803]